MENKYKVHLKKVFSFLEKGDYKTFWDYFSDDVTWIVEGTHPLAGKYKSLADFRKATFDRLQSVLTSPIRFKIREILVDGSQAAIVMEGEAKTKNGTPFNNRYCWVVNIAANDKIDHVDAYLDSHLIAQIFEESEASC